MKSWLLILAALLPVGAPAALVDYFTLNDALTTPGGGRVDLSGSGLGAGDLSVTVGTGSTTVVAGQIGDALQFPNTLILNSANSPGIAFPFTLSIWLKTNSTANVTDKAILIGDTADTDRDFSLGILPSPRAALLVGRTDTGPNNLTSAPTTVNDGNWHLLTGVFASATSRTLYLDGKFSGSTAVSMNLWADNASTRLNVGGFNRASGPVDQFDGALDDAGLFNNALNFSDAAAIWGLGRTGGIGLDQLDEAQALFGGPFGGQGDIGGFFWEKVSGLGGTAGDFGGTTAGGDAFVVLDNSGNGIAMVPEPSAMVSLLLGSFVFARRRRARA
jgi:hypothetical protein